MRFCIPKENCQKFKTYFNSLSEIFENATFKFKTDGLEIFELDTAQILICNVFFPISFFSEYTTNVEYQEIIIPMFSFNKIIKYSDSKNELVLEYNKEFPDVMSIKFADCEFEIKLIYNDASNNVTIPEYHGNTFQVESEYFHKTIKQLSEFTETIHIKKELGTDKIVFTSTESTSTQTNCKSSINCVSINDNSVDACLSTKYLNFISKNYTFSDKIIIHFYDNYPLLFILNYKESVLKFYVARKDN
jgi:hypothetical protein